jgi:hypothetical protein
VRSPCSGCRPCRCSTHCWSRGSQLTGRAPTCPGCQSPPSAHCWHSPTARDGRSTPWHPLARLREAWEERREGEYKSEEQHCNHRPLLNLASRHCTTHLTKQCQKPTCVCLKTAACPTSAACRAARLRTKTNQCNPSGFRGGYKGAAGDLRVAI